MNFEIFPAIKHSDNFFWIVSIPVVLVSTVYLLRERFARQFVKWAKKKDLRDAKKRRLTGKLTGWYQL